MPKKGIQVRVEKIVSGGQTGVDRAALDAAISLGIPHGGWCPKGRIAEDGVIPSHYQLNETDSADYPTRTELNVIDSDATLILYRDELQGGTDLTRRLAKKHEKPYLLVDLSERMNAIAVRKWLHENDVRVLNLAGPRKSSVPGIEKTSQRFLERLLAE